jgi:hypothetical protein
MYPVNRWLRWFAKSGDELIGEVPLDSLSLDALRALFGAPAHDPMYDSFPVRTEHIAILQSKVNHPIDLERYDYFVEADAAE